MFEGIKKTFKPRDGYAEDARYMGTTKVATTVLNYCKEEVRFSQQ